MMMYHNEISNTPAARVTSGFLCGPSFGLPRPGLLWGTLQNIADPQSFDIT